MEEDSDEAVEDEEGKVEDERGDGDEEDEPGRLGDCEELDDDILAWVSMGFFTVKHPNDGLMTQLTYLIHASIGLSGFLMREARKLMLTYRP